MDRFCCCCLFLFVWTFSNSFIYDALKFEIIVILDTHPALVAQRPTCKAKQLTVDYENLTQSHSRFHCKQASLTRRGIILPSTALGRNCLTFDSLMRTDLTDLSSIGHENRRYVQHVTTIDI